MIYPPQPHKKLAVFLTTLQYILQTFYMYIHYIDSGQSIAFSGRHYTGYSALILAFWPVNCKKGGGHIALQSSFSGYLFFCGFPCFILLPASDMVISYCITIELRIFLIFLYHHFSNWSVIQMHTIDIRESKICLVY